MARPIGAESLPPLPPLPPRKSESRTTVGSDMRHSFSKVESNAPSKTGLVAKKSISQHETPTSERRLTSRSFSLEVKEGRVMQLLRRLSTRIFGPSIQPKEKPPLPPLPPNLKVATSKTPPPLPPPYMRQASAVVVKPLTANEAAKVAEAVRDASKSLEELHLASLTAAECPHVLAKMNPSLYTKERLAAMTPQAAYYALVKEIDVRLSSMIDGVKQLKGFTGESAKRSEALYLDLVCDRQYEVTEFLGKFQEANRQAQPLTKSIISDILQGKALDALGPPSTKETIAPEILAAINQRCHEMEPPMRELREAWNYNRPEASRDSDAFTYHMLRRDLNEMEETFQPRKEMTLNERVAFMRFQAKKKEIAEAPLSTFVNFTASNKKMLRKMEESDAKNWIPGYAKVFNAIGSSGSRDAYVQRITRCLAKQMAVDLYGGERPVERLNSMAARLWEKLSGQPELQREIVRELQKSGSTLLDSFEERILK